MIAIILLIAAIIAVNKDKLLVSGLLTLVVVGIHNILGLLLGLCAGKMLKLRYDKTTALAIEVGMQNSGLAVTLAATNFALNPLATLVGAIFSVWHNISGAIFASIRRDKISSYNKSPFTGSPVNGDLLHMLLISYILSLTRPITRPSI